MWPGTGRSLSHLRDRAVPLTWPNTDPMYRVPAVLLTPEIRLRSRLGRSPGVRQAVADV